MQQEIHLQEEPVMILLLELTGCTILPPFLCRRGTQIGPALAHVD